MSDAALTLKVEEAQCELLSCQDGMLALIEIVVNKEPHVQRFDRNCKHLNYLLMTSQTHAKTLCGDLFDILPATHSLN